MKCHRKDIIVDAVQWFPGVHIERVQEIVHDPGDGSTVSNNYGIINTHNGPLHVDSGDWVITGSVGEVYVLTDHQFNSTFAPIEKDVEKIFIKYYNFIEADAHKNSVDHGFWEGEQNEAEKLCLMHSELSEALESLRKGNPPDKHLPQYKNIEVELADLIIRVMDLSGAKGYRVAEAVVDKMSFNRNRPHKHGKKF